MQVSVRPPDTSAVSPHRQCGGDWDFWLESALEFLASADGRLQEPLEGESFGKMAHSLKTGAELLTLTSISLAAYELEKSHKTGGDEIEKLQLQVVLLERIGEALTVLNTPDMRKNAKRILEEAGGRFDLILTPNAPRRTSAIDNSSAPAPPTTFPPRVAVVSSELTTRKLVAAAVTNGTNAELATFETLAEAANDSAPVIVVCVCEETPLVPPAQLSRTMPAGGRRSYVFVGELDTAEQDMVHVTGTGWCETVRMPLAPGELMRRISAVYASSA